jgi:hypothetical protein
MKNLLDNIDDYLTIDPIRSPIQALRQGARRHYGVHPYFTRRPFNVVQRYVTHYSREGDTVMDPFGGSGVTAIEAFLENRIGVHNDINPLANFIASGVAGLSSIKLNELVSTFEDIKARCEPALSKIDELSPRTVQSRLKKLDLPENVSLPDNADVPRLFDLYSDRQLLGLALIWNVVKRIDGADIRHAMLLVFSATLAKLNRTFLSAHGRAASRGGSSIFSIYRYKIANDPVALPYWSTFEERFFNVLEAKREIDVAIDVKRQTSGWVGRFVCEQLDITELADKYKGKIDYIFTDPPYGGHIAYLDLSTMWNAWLQTMPTDESRAQEIIVGGQQRHGEELYVRRLSDSVSACIKMLKPNRWMSIVFQHWNMRYFEAILSAAAQGRASLKAAISQTGDPIWSMHKKKGKESVLSGETILTFVKSGTRAPPRRSKPFDIEIELAAMLGRSRRDRIFGEEILNFIVLRAWEAGAISSIKISKNGFAEMLKGLGYEYDSSDHSWQRIVRQEQLI